MITKFPILEGIDMDENTIVAIIEDMINDISDRRGIGDEWSEIDEDIKDEIRATWIEIIKKHANPEGLNNDRG
jgi:hypothetical protein